MLAVTEGPVAPSNANLGQVVLILAAVAVLVWVAYLVIASRRGAVPTPEETPKNLQPYLSDDELENHRLNRVLGAAVIAAAVLAVSLPVYYIGESRRQAEAAEAFHEKDIEEGHRWYAELFLCADCHGPDGGGGGADFIEARSGLSPSWAAPSINDVFYRYSEEETAYWLNFGRSGTPMPVAGLVGGGAGTIQEIDQVMAYLRSIEVSQDEVLSTIETQVSQALGRIESADVTVARLARDQQAVIDDILDADEQFAAIEDLPSRVRALMAGDGTCTDRSAAAVGSTCRRAGADSDRDGLTDELERELAGEGNTIASVVDTTILVRDVTQSDEPLEITPGGQVAYEATSVQNGELTHLYGLTLDPADAFTMTDAAGEPIPDLEAVESFLGDLDNAHLNLSVTSSRADVFLANATTGLDFLLAAAERRAWVVDFDQVAADTGLSLGDAERAVGLFNAYCARCHTAGYAAGVAFQQDAGSGAWAPALGGGRSVVQFPNEEDQVDFIIKGSNEAENYGVNGLGRGWMPGFGQILSEADIRLIVAYERSL
jgi:mono/diheme cytochrome c family protein